MPAVGRPPDSGKPEDTDHFSARFGGEKFACIFPNTDPSTAELVLLNISKAPQLRDSSPTGRTLNLPRRAFLKNRGDLGQALTSGGSQVRCRRTHFRANRDVAFTQTTCDNSPLSEDPDSIQGTHCAVDGSEIVRQIAVWPDVQCSRA